jgi:hypothetical protein
MSERSERFFAWVWRLNGLAFLGVALVGLIAAVGVAINLALYSEPDRPESRLVQVAGTDLGDKNLRLTGFTPIAGGSLLYATLAEQDDSMSSNFSKGYRTSRNVLFFDTQTKRAHWLLAKHDQEIPSLVFLKQPPGSGYMWETGESTKEGQRVVGILAETQPLSREASGTGAGRDIAFAAPDGRTSKTLVKASQGLLGYHQAGASTVFIFYVARGEARVLDLNLASGEVQSDAALTTEP